MKHLAAHLISWRALALVTLVVLTPGTSGGTRPTAMAGGGGGIDPIPPLASAGPVGNLATPPGEPLRLRPLIVAIDGSAPSYAVVVTDPSGAVIALGATDAQGIVTLALPGIAGLELDVIGTSVVGLPVHAGQTVAITIL